MAATTRTKRGQTQVVDEIVVNDRPGAPNAGYQAPTPGERVALPADLTREYVAGGTGGAAVWYQNLARSLAWAIDDLSADLGDDIYERMSLDAQVASCVAILKASIIEDGITLAPAVDDEDADGYALAQELADLGQRMLDGLDTPLDDVLWNMLDAVALGNRVAEQSYLLDRTYTGKEQVTLVALRVKPRTNLAFVVDTFNRLLGFLALIPGLGLVPLQQLIYDPRTVPNLLPRDKFAVLTFRPVGSDPRGTSVLRPAYTFWNLKQQVVREHLKYLAQFASPWIIGTTPEGAMTQPALDADGNPIAGTPISPEQAMVNALTNGKNGTAAAFPFGSQFTVIESKGEGRAFLNAYEYYDSQITKAILSQTLATNEGQHQARAAAGVHQDILDTIVRQAKRAVCRMVARDILAPWVRYNYGERAVELTPAVSLGTLEQPDLPALWTAAAALKTASYFAPSQLADVDAMLNFPRRQPEEVEQLSQMREQLTEQQPSANEGDDLPPEGAETREEAAA